MNGPKLIYLHGFASGPGSTKARFFADRFRERGIDMQIPTLDEGDFERLTLSRQLRVLEQAAGGRPVVLLGSSMGAYLAALYGARHPEVEKLVLMAPALRFTTRWAEMLGETAMAEWKSTGRRPMYHYAMRRECDIGYQLFEDALRYEDYPAVNQPTLVFHGLEDQVVPARDSAHWAAQHPNVVLRLMESGHELTDVLEPLWTHAAAFLGVR